MEPLRAIVTGAASGIGRAIAAGCVRDGHRVLAVDRRPDPDGPGTPFEADLSTPDGNARVIEAARREFGGVDAIVANAGLQHIAPIASFDEVAWDRVLAVLLTSPFLLAKYAWPDLVSSTSGRFIAVASVHGLAASPYKAAYVAAKHGLLGLIKVLALEGAGSGITATAVCPGYVRTPLVERQIEEQARAHGISAGEVLEKVILAQHAVKRLIEPEEVADLVSYLLGPSASMITGTPVVMDGGWLAR